MTTAGQKGQWAATPQEFASAPARVGVRPPAAYIAETWQTGDAMDEVSIGHLKECCGRFEAMFHKCVEIS